MKFTKLLSRFLNSWKLFRKYKHKYRIKKSHDVRKKLLEISKSKFFYPKIIVYLKKIDPYVFEELIMSAIEESNIRVYRNTSYSNDGGIDGAFKCSYGKFFIQCKRYQNHINAKHVIKFASIVNMEKVKGGIFVHTGKTGALSKHLVKNNPDIVFISGEKLVDLILNKKSVEEIIQQKKLAFKH
jgi:restriction system protein